MRLRTLQIPSALPGAPRPGQACAAFACVIWLAAGSGRPLPARESPAEPARPGNTFEDPASGFALRTDRGAITSLRRLQDAHDTDYVRAGGRFGDLIVKWRPENQRRPGDERREGGEPWRSLSTFELARAGKVETSPLAPGRGQRTHWGPPGDAAEAGLEIETALDGLRWTIALRNLSREAIEVGGLAFPCPMNTDYVWDRETTYHRRVIRHSFVSGHGSYMFWMRCDATPPFLLLTPLVGTSLEYFDTVPRDGARSRSYTVYIHSLSENEVLLEKGTRWRQPATAAVLAPRGSPGDRATYGFKLSWVDGHDAVRRSLVEEGLVDVRVAPGMTVPADLDARLALRSRGGIRAVEAEFPELTEVRPTPSADPSAALWTVRFHRLGENLLTVRWGEGRSMVLEFFVAEPLETLVRKRARFLARSQHRDPLKWYDGLITDWNLRDKVLLSPDDLSTVPESRRYMVTCDDPGLAKPAFLAAKNAEFPEASEVEALDGYIERFVWGGLQRTDAEHHGFGVYGIQDWKRNRESADEGAKGRLHIWRIYDYPHVVMLYLNMARIARRYPEVRARLPADEYLRRAHGTALAYFTYPLEIQGWSPYETGTYNEVCIEELMEELDRRGWRERAEELRKHWNRKVEFFVGGRANLFGSEYPFDSTGFESTHAFARYVLRGAGRGAEGTGGPRVSKDEALRFLQQQIQLNIGCRGWLEPAYYLLGSDYRAGGNAHYTLSYMSAMGGWAVLDNALHHAEAPHAYLPLGYASILASWALLNSGTPEANFGYWYPGPENDGGAGGGFEPAPYGRTWLGQPHHRGAWFYACESDLGFCGFLRAAATVFAEDPVFGPLAYGGACERKGDRWEVRCKDGVRRRFHIVRGPWRVHLEIDRDHIAADAPVSFDDGLRSLTFTIESQSPTAHATALRVSGLPAGDRRLFLEGKAAPDLRVEAGGEILAELPIDRPRVSVSLTAR